MPGITSFQVLVPISSSVLPEFLLRKGFWSCVLCWTEWPYLPYGEKGSSDIWITHSQLQDESLTQTYSPAPFLCLRSSLAMFQHDDKVPKKQGGCLGSSVQFVWFVPLLWAWSEAENIMTWDHDGGTCTMQRDGEWAHTGWLSLTPAFALSECPGRCISCQWHSGWVSPCRLLIDMPITQL